MFPQHFSIIVMEKPLLKLNIAPQQDSTTVL
jgi:hypothetical protein